MDSEGLGLLAVFVVGMAIGLLIANDQAFDRGVKAHAEGRYVVVQMPDGTEQVCKVKEAPDGK